MKNKLITCNIIKLIVSESTINNHSSTINLTNSSKSMFPSLFRSHFTIISSTSVPLMLRFIILFSELYKNILTSTFVSYYLSTQPSPFISKILKTFSKLQRFRIYFSSRLAVMNSR